MSHWHRLDDFTRGRVIGMLESGRTQTDVAETVGTDQSTVSRLWERYRTTGDVARRPTPGRPRVTTPADDRYVALTARRNRTLPGRALASELSAAGGPLVSRQTIYRRLRQQGLYARRPVICPPLSSRARRERLLWCREHRLWTPQQWSTVLFSDESRFSLESDDRRVFIWREAGMRYNPLHVREIHPFRGGSILVWGGIMSNGRTPLYTLSGRSMTALRYRNEILEPHVRLFRGAVGPDFNFMDDNARPHRTADIMEYLESEDIHRLPWPSYSPDLNPIEHAWDALGRRITGLQPPPTTLNDLRSALVQEWDNLPQVLFTSLINSMPQRCNTCVSVHGHHIPY